MIDQNIEINKEHGEAYSLRIVYNLIKSTERIFSLNSCLLKIGTPTFRHGNGMNNFINRGKPLGWMGGSDGIEWKLGANYFNRRNIISYFFISYFNEGEENILSRPYEPYYDYLVGTFPSGDNSERTLIETGIEWWWKPNISFSIFAEFKNYEENKKEFTFGLKINAFLERLLNLDSVI